jgi:hypothetical protein
MTRVVDFTDGFSSATAPSTTGVEASSLQNHADDAAFVTAKGTPASNGDIYYNTTSHTVRVYKNGAWVEESATIESALKVNDTTQSTDKDTGALIVEGGAGIEKNLNVGGAVKIDDTTQSTGKDNGSLIVEGGVGVEKNLNVGGNIIVTGDLQVDGTTTTVNSTTLDVTDANITVNKGGNQSTADSADAGLTVEMSDATDALIHYDSTATSKFKAGESGSTVELADISSSQVITNKDIDGGTASNTNRLTVPKDTKANLDALTRKEATLVYASDENKLYADDGSELAPIGGGGVGSPSIFKLFNFDDDKVTDWTESAGTLSEETVNQLNGDTSL